MFSFRVKREQKNKGKVLIVDSIEPWRNSLVEILGKMNYQVSVAQSYDEAINHMAKETFDVAVIEPRLDIEDPSDLDGMRLAALIRNTQQSTKTLIYTGFGNYKLIRDLFNYGASDFLDKKKGLEYIIAAIENALSTPSVSHNFRALTIPEQEVLELIVKGKTDNEIAKELNKANNTIKKHVTNILAKLDASKRSQIAAISELYHLAVVDKDVHPSTGVSNAYSSPSPKLTKSENREQSTLSDNQPKLIVNEKLSENKEAKPTLVDNRVPSRTSRRKNSATPKNKTKEKKDVATNKQRPLRVFLCHSSGDKPKVKSLYGKLGKHKWIDPWLDENKLLPGEDWDVEIRRAVKVSEIVIVCLSFDSITKEGYVQKEIKLALDIADEKPEGTIYIIPLKLEDCDVPERLSKLHWVNYYEPNKSIKKLLSSLRERATSLGIQTD